MARYSPVGDLIVISIGFVILLLLFFSYVSKTRSYKIFVSIVINLILCAMADVASYSLTRASSWWAYVMWCLFHALLFLLFLQFAVYICEVGKFGQKLRQIFQAIAVVLYVVIVVIDIIITFSGEFSVSEDGKWVLRQGQQIYIYSYCAFFLLMVIMLVVARHTVYSRVMYGFYGAIAISFLVLLVQGVCKESSYTVATFYFPILAMFYSMHSNPYNAHLGAADGTAFADYVHKIQHNGQTFIYMSFYLKLFQEDDVVVPDALQASIRYHSAKSFNHSMLFQPERGHLILAAVKEQNPDYQNQIRRALMNFQKEYDKYHYDCRLLIGESSQEITNSTGYLSFFQIVRDHMEENGVHFVDENDVKRYHRFSLILKNLEDIYKKRDLNDPRVLAYCQPVYNVRTRSYETAEALMRLQIDGEIIPPDEFVRVAEKKGYIHVLTMIILHKTCEAIKYFCEQGYFLSRISVNVSALELKEENFTEDVVQVIAQSGVPDDKIAIELTESQTYSDFLIMKEAISKLKEKGVIFYLDDFGTGYSNMERIMEIPFDIIKFDRSLVLASRESQRSRNLVLGMSNIFASMNYAVLYEGVEEDIDEAMCIDMSASYLQGFKYSRPVPIMELVDYLMRR